MSFFSTKVRRSNLPRVILYSVIALMKLLSDSETSAWIFIISLWVVKPAYSLLSDISSVSLAAFNWLNE